MTKPLGTFQSYSQLDSVARQVVDLACFGADCSANHKLCFQSDFPVGAGILAENDAGETKMFSGCNVENNWFPATICAERTAATRAAFEGYKRFKRVAVFCRKFPGGSPCGLCRQVLTQFGCDAVLYNVVDRDRGVRVATVGDLLPAAALNKPLLFSELSGEERRIIKRVKALALRSHVPYSKRPRGALREFGAHAMIILVGADRSLRTSLDELLPDSFGPEAL